MGLPSEMVIEALVNWDYLSVMSINHDYSKVSLLRDIDETIHALVSFTSY